MINDSVEFSKNIPPEQLAVIFKDYFEQHMAAYYILKGVEFVTVNKVDVDKASIMYSVRILNENQKEELVEKLKRRSGSISIYGHMITPDIFLNGDLLCITIKK